MKMVRNRVDVEGRPYVDLIGLRCDRCGKEARHNLDTTDASIAIAASAEVGEYVRIDIDFGTDLIRAELCQECSDDVLNSIRPNIQYFRGVGRRDPTRHYSRVHHFEVYDVVSGRTFEVRSMCDEDLSLHLS